MIKDKKMEFGTEWYELWMKQSRDFFTTANDQLKGVFEKDAFSQPKMYEQQINAWLEMLKGQWQQDAFKDQQKIVETYWLTMGKMCSEACDMMVEQWYGRANSAKPIHNVNELYEVWLNCCNDIYNQAMHSKSYQDIYGDFMQTALKFWKSAIPK